MVGSTSDSFRPQDVTFIAIASEALFMITHYEINSPEVRPLEAISQTFTRQTNTVQSR